MRLSKARERSANFQFLRFVAALFVIISHAFPLSLGRGHGDGLLRLTGGALSMGGLAVAVFFTGGGYFTAKSMDRLKDGRSFFKARALKIFPPLMTVVFLLAFAAGPLLSAYSPRAYFSDPRVYRYLLNGVLILQHNLPGVFLNSPYAQTVNGALWTLPVEFLCYIACYLLWRLGFFKEERALWSVPPVLLGAGAVFWAADFWNAGILKAVVRPGLLFYMGSLYYILRDRVELKGRTAFFCLLLILLSTPFRLLNAALVLFFPYLLLWLCFGIAQVPDALARWGNFSYGTYLCAYPIQSAWTVLCGGRTSPAGNILLCAPLAVLGGFLVYQAVERPIIKWERGLKRREG